jgi:hypothetical protein
VQPVPPVQAEPVDEVHGTPAQQSPLLMQLCP